MLWGPELRTHTVQYTLFVITTSPIQYCTVLYTEARDVWRRRVSDMVPTTYLQVLHGNYGTYLYEYLRVRVLHSAYFLFYTTRTRGLRTLL